MPRTNLYIVAFTFLDPALVVERMAPDVGHAVDCGRPTETLSARLKDAPAGEMPLRHRVEAPVPRTAFEVRSQRCRHADRPVIGPSPGLDEQHPEVGVLAQTRREDTTSRSGTHDDVVELGHGRTRWLPVVGILRAMAGASNPVSCRAASRATPTPPSARPGSARIAAPSSAVRRCGIVLWWHIRDRIRIVRHSAANLDRRPCPPDAPATIWTTREVERDRFRSADGLVDRSVTMMPGDSCLTVALTEALDSSPHWGPVRSLVCGPYASLPDSDMTVSEELSTVHAEGTHFGARHGAGS